MFIGLPQAAFGTMPHALRWGSHQRHDAQNGVTFPCMLARGPLMHWRQDALLLNSCLAWSPTLSARAWDVTTARFVGMYESKRPFEALLAQVFPCLRASQQVAAEL